jgi:hypothetical protein
MQLSQALVVAPPASEEGQNGNKHGFCPLYRGMTVEDSTFPVDNASCCVATEVYVALQSCENCMEKFIRP